MKHDELVSLGNKYYTPNYNPRSVILEKGSGSYVFDVDGKKYLDLGSGIGVNSLGYNNSELMDALTLQAGKLWHTSNIYFSEPPVLLAQALVEHTFAERAFFCNSGAEANEAAIKIARKFAYENYTKDKRIILTFEGSFHGRTIATISAAAQTKYQEGFGPLPGGFRYCKFNDIDALCDAFDQDICAVLIEPIQGESGIWPATSEFLLKIRELCDANDTLLIFDEVQCGMGRTGKLFAYQWTDAVKPDLVTVAKAFGGGLPIGATLVGAKAAETLSYGSHGSTFGGNAICCAVAHVVFRRVSDKSFLAEITKKGDQVFNSLRKFQKTTSVIQDVRGIGLMIGVELSDDCRHSAAEVMDLCRENGLLILQAGQKVARFLPSLSVTYEDLNDGIEIFKETIRNL